MKIEFDKIYKTMGKTCKESDFLTFEELMNLRESGNVIFDPFSIFISKRAQIGKRNIFYPHICIECDENSKIKIGDKNFFHPNTRMTSLSGGVICIGNKNYFEGNIALKADIAGANISIADTGRYANNVEVIGNCSFGSGAQLLGGSLTIENCTLEGGGSFTDTDPGTRAGLIKGFGTARGILVEQGKMLNGKGKMSIDQIEPQSFYHSLK